jgi:transcriptional regulator with GAF, ATPase, and Fis domain
MVATELNNSMILPDRQAEAAGDAETHRLMQQLQLHRIELEMQNEELQRAQEELKASRTQVDQRVLARTAELSQAIESLSVEIRARHRAEQSLLGACTELEHLRDRLQAENAGLHQQLDRFELAGLPGPSPAMAELRSRIETAAACENPVLLLGEAGTGQRAVARAVHNRSARRHRAMLSTSCAALPEDLLQVMLFGHQAGDCRRIGQFELAAQSTLFLDEVGSLPLALQATLAGAIRQLACIPPGSPAGARAEVKLIVASNRDLQQEVRQGRFREDLYACLGSCPITVPPLREHLEDIPTLVAELVARFNRTLGKRFASVPDSSLEHLMARPWPGNIKELAGVIELAMISAPGPDLEL